MARSKRLKGNTTTGDTRMDRVIQFDERSRAYALRRRKRWTPGMAVPIPEGARTTRERRSCPE